MKKILILGAYGYLGNYLSNFLENKYHVFQQGRNPGSQIIFDPLDFESLKEYVIKIKPEIIINLIAETNVDECEKAPDLANKVNAYLIRDISDIINLIDKNIFFIHISTDQVYCGSGPHKENFAKPINIYGKSKLLGESLINVKNFLVLRTNFIGRSKIKNKLSLADWIINSLRNKIKITVFKDILFNPLHVLSLCKQIEYTISLKISGIFNLGSNSSISKADMAFYLADKLKLDKSYLELGRSYETSMIAKRNQDMRVCIEKYEKTFDTSLPHIDSELYKLTKDFN